MRIEIQGQGLPLTAALLEYTQARLRFALTRTSSRIKRVVVRLGNTDRPRGGDDKFCRVQVFLEHSRPVLVEDSGLDLHAVIGRAAERAGRNVTKSIEGLRERFRLQMMPQPTATLSSNVFDALKN